jgi:DnaJ-class molecular chaperone
LQQRLDTPNQLERLEQNRGFGAEQLDLSLVPSTRYAIGCGGDHRSARMSVAITAHDQTLETSMANEKGPNIKKKAKCKNCEGKGLLKKGDKVVKCQRCHGTGVR